MAAESAAVVTSGRTLALRPLGESLTDRLDERKIDQLRAWGMGLAASGSDDLRATGKAILMLIEEIERLHIDLWNAKQEQTPWDRSAGGNRDDVHASVLDPFSSAHSVAWVVGEHPRPQSFPQPV